MFGVVLRFGLLVCFIACCSRSDAQKTPIDFAADIQPILEQHCLSCHNEQNDEGGVNLSTREAAIDCDCIEPSSAVDSTLYTTTALKSTDEMLMPPKNAGGPLSRTMKNKLRRWIDEGATWPSDLTLEKKPKQVTATVSIDDIDLVAQIRDFIIKTSSETANQTVGDYEEVIPKTGARFQMVAIEAGPFQMGSPADEADRSQNEGPQKSVSVSGFWIGKHEVTWDEYEPYMITQVDREKHGGRTDYDPAKHSVVDGVSQPTPPYTEMSFGMGQQGFPAISMTQHAANKYCQWLSAQTGRFYRLPTEAEWEYACRAGTTTPYSFGDGPIEDYAWFSDNSDEKYQKVGLKKPNPWGLHDMHGNVREWTADQFHDDYFGLIDSAATNPFHRPSKLYPRAVRGGGWEDSPEQLRSASRIGSSKDWKQSDPQLPQSIWYHTDAPWVGFRVIRPIEIPTLEEMYFYWNSATGMKF